MVRKNLARKLWEVLVSGLILFNLSTAGLPVALARGSGIPEIRFTLPAPKLIRSLNLPIPAPIIQIIDQIQNIVVQPTGCPVAQDAPSVCNLAMGDTSDSSNDFPINWTCNGSAQPCSLLGSGNLVGQFQGSARGFFNVGNQRYITYQMQDQKGQNCGSGTAHSFAVGVFPPPPPPAPASPTYNLSGYRWFFQADSVTPGAAVASQNTATPGSNGTNNFRIRMLIRVTNAQVDVGGQSFKMQVASKSGTCDASTYSDLLTSGSPAFYNNTTPSDGDTISLIASDPTDGSNTRVAQNYQEANNFTNNVAIPAGQDGLWDFSIGSNGSFGSWCFRAVKSDGTLLDTYDQYPLLQCFGEGTC